MSNFMKGFNAGFTPYVGNIADLISNTIYRNSRQDKQFYNDMALQNNQRIADQEKLRMKLEQEQVLENQQKKLYEEFIKDPIGNAYLYGSMTPSMAARANDYISMQPKNKIVEESDENYKYLNQYTEDKLGNRKFIKELKKTKIPKQTKTITRDGVTKKYNVFSDGTQELADTKINYDDVRDFQSKEQGKLLGYDKKINEALSSYEKIGILYDSAYKRGKANAIDDNLIDYKDSDLAYLDYKNKKTAIEFDLRKEMSEPAWGLINSIESYNLKNPSTIKDIKEELNAAMIEGLENKEITEEDIIWIGKAFRLKTGVPFD